MKANFRRFADLCGAESAAVGRCWRVGDLTIDYVERTIRERLFCALITEEEDDCLTDEGWQRRMPDDWDFDTGDILARYKAVGIQMHKF